MAHLFAVAARLHRATLWQHSAGSLNRPWEGQWPLPLMAVPSDLAACQTRCQQLFCANRNMHEAMMHLVLSSVSPLSPLQIRQVLLWGCVLLLTVTLPAYRFLPFCPRPKNTPLLSSTLFFPYPYKPWPALLSRQPGSPLALPPAFKPPQLFVLHCQFHPSGPPPSSFKTSFKKVSW